MHMPYSIVTRSVNLCTPKATKKTKRFIVGECDYCGVPFEQRYLASTVQAADKRGYIGCSRSCGAKLREARIAADPNASRRRRRLRSAATTKRNKAWHAGMSPIEKKKMYAKVSKTTRETYQNWPDEKLSAHKLKISRSVSQTWRENHDKIVEKQAAGYCRAWKHAGYAPFMSKAEIVLGDAFEELLGGSEHVKRQHPMLGSIIDIYLPRFDIYIEVDGTYFHGIDKSLQELFERRHEPRGRKRLRQRIADIKQDRRFDDAGHTLVRVCSEEVVDDPSAWARYILVVIGDNRYELE